MSSEAPNPDPIIDALRASLESNPKNPEVWLHLAQLLQQAGRPVEAVDALRNAQQTGGPEPATSTRLVALLRETGQLAEALIRAEAVAEQHTDRALDLELWRVLVARGDTEGAQAQEEKLRSQYGDLSPEELSNEAASPQQAQTSETPSVIQPTPAEPKSETPQEQVSNPGVDEDRLIEVGGSHEEEDLEAWASQFDWGDLKVSFDDVAGLDDVKRQIRLRIIAPLENQSVYQAFQRKAGGGILLYGPPGCGKTFIARATAGECNARFVSVSIHEMVDKYWGESEKLVHALFDEARRRAPTVLFFDEFDALGSSRGSSGSQFWRTMVDQLLQEMDGMASDNENVLVFAATNVPWNIDPAFRRPGRFDRMFFVPPPDRTGRAHILRRNAEKLPGGEAVPFEKLAKATSLWTGADLKALCERASERALERSLESGDIHPVKPADFDRELADMDSSAMEWLATAKNYARYANEGGQYDALRDFLRKTKRW